MALLWVKLGFAAGVLVVALCSTLVPWAVAPRQDTRGLDLGNTLAGGVLLGAGLIHLLHDGITGFGDALPRLHYPLALMLAGVGVLLILLIESVLVAGRRQRVPRHPDPQPAVMHETGGPPSESQPVAVVLLLVLSVHSAILGLALGAQDSVAGAVVVLLAILAHKTMAGFALGISHRRAGFSRRDALPRLALFATMTPLGVLVGAAAGVALTGQGDQLFEATFNSLGAGTFLYIASVDILKTEFDSPHHRGQKWFATALGLALMALLAVWL